MHEVERYAQSTGWLRLTGEVFSNDYTALSTEIDERARWFKSLGFKVRRAGDRRWRLSKLL